MLEGGWAAGGGGRCCGGEVSDKNILQYARRRVWFSGGGRDQTVAGRVESYQQIRKGLALSMREL